MEEDMKVHEPLLAMNGGDGRYSYVKNSCLQRKAVAAAKAVINEAISDKLDLNLLSNGNPFWITDLGCSTGPNTFIAVQNIVEAIEQKYQAEGLTSHIPEFQVFFSDRTSNDFNTLFASLPPERRYFAAGVPGSFHARLFPEKSIHFVHSSFAIQWLSRVPKEVLDMKSSAWNKGRIHYTNAKRAVVEAYSDQYAKDIESFLNARAMELVDGGLMALVFPIIPNGTTRSQSDLLGIWFDLLGSTLMDMVKMGVVSEAQVDSFNLPVYTTTPDEVKAAVRRNGCFRIEKFELMPSMTGHDTMSNEVICMHTRAGLEGIIGEHFGREIIEELFHLYSLKLAASPSILKSGSLTQAALLVVRKVG